MPYNGLADGLYLIVGHAPRKLVAHYGVLDVGNRSGVQAQQNNGPIVIHLTVEGLVWQSLDSILREWNIEGGRVADEVTAIERMNVAAANPTYDLTENNCEQFARYVITGKHESKQLQAVGWMTAGAVVAAIFFGNSGNDDDGIA